MNNAEQPRANVRWVMQ